MAHSVRVAHLPLWLPTDLSTEFVDIKQRQCLMTVEQGSTADCCFGHAKPMPHGRGEGLPAG
jgi:hypothetical protein